MAAADLIDSDIAAAVLRRALARGGDFAELFCEERQGFTLSIDEFVALARALRNLGKPEVHP